MHAWVGETRLDPGPYSLAELKTIQEAHRQTHWDPFAHLMATLANCHRGENVPPYRPAQFHPFAATPATTTRGRRLTRANFDDFRALTLSTIEH